MTYPKHKGYTYSIRAKRRNLINKKVTFIFAAVLIVGGFIAAGLPDKPKPHVLTTPQPASQQVISGSLNGQAYTIGLPKGYNLGSHRLLIFMHGANQPQDMIFTEAHRKAITDQFLKDGYIVAASVAHGLNWGNEPSVQDQIDLYTYLHTHYKVSHTYIWSESMGGLDGLKIVSRHSFPDLSAWLGTYPVSNLLSMTRNSVIKDQINLAYNGKPDYAGSPVNLTGYNVPMRVYHSYADTVVLRKFNTDMLGMKTPIEVITTTGDHGDPSNFNSSINDFMNAH